jgi:hypothetical protein
VGDEVEALNNIFSAYGAVFSLALIIVVVLLLGWLLTLQMRLNKMSNHYRRLISAGRGGRNLEEILESQMDGWQEIDQKMDRVMEAARRVESDYRQAIQHVGILRFNPFSDTGGDQSFCVAMLNGDGSGVVLTSIYNRNNCRVYAKPVENGQCRYQMSAEEVEALRLALNGDDRAPEGKGRAAAAHSRVG